MIALTAMGRRLRGAFEQPPRDNRAEASLLDVNGQDAAALRSGGRRPPPAVVQGPVRHRRTRRSGRAGRRA